MKDKILVKTKWQSNKVLFAERVFLICFGEKCMSGKITAIKELDDSGFYSNIIEFIEPKYFENEAKVGNFFTIREFKTVLGEGEVIGIL